MQPFPSAPVVVIAPDSFKGSLSAQQVTDAIAAGLRRARPDAIVRGCPMADGGEGTLDAMLADIASLCERQVDERIGALTSLCEPLVVIVLGVLVGALVVAMYLPIVQLGNVV
ncbi:MULTISPECIES: glycerate kinase [unclassified Burkholderia]|uniref:glycerate kinase n=1 Tax=unclassified Burkholderia TaxID=2613784 RepID=UPI0014216045|nr:MULTISPECIES: glycerate kinase [unclassified Burkholderia]NIE83251.1 hypothetical protein [Burkholderia sp. Tr-860]NIF62161.1 hypothetical protein [Burkholderia sp. Cy-647]NIF96458.1 hypothetical protein [Burkholderia sp. Ax-1720]